jgi:hypothetical protein
MDAGLDAGSALDALGTTDLSQSDAKITYPPLDCDNLRGAYVVTGTWRDAWKDIFGVTNIYAGSDAEPSTLKQAMDDASRDLRNMGFNAVVLSPYFFAARQWISWQTFAEYFAEAAAKHGLCLVVGFIEPSCDFGGTNCSNGSSHDAWVKTCEMNSKSQDLVNALAPLDNVKGFLCAYEAWNSGAPYSTNKIKQMQTFIEGKGDIYLNVPGANVSGPAAFSVVTEQRNPCPHCGVDLCNNCQPTGTFACSANCQATMDSANTAAMSKGFGVELNIWHSLLKSGKAAAQGWIDVQHDSMVKLAPTHTTYFDYAKWVAIKLVTPSGTRYYYEPRGALININARLQDPTLLLHDPLESIYSTKIIGGTASGVTISDGHCAALPLNASGGRVDGRGALLSAGATLSYPTAGSYGTLMMRVKPNWDGADGQRHMLLSTVCTGGKNCFRLEKSADGALRFVLYDAGGTAQTVQTSVSSWAAGTWHHIAAAWSEGTNNRYLAIDGAMVDSATTPAWTITDSAVSNTLWVGALTGGGEHSAEAVIDALRIYKTWKNSSFVADAATRPCDP